MEVQIEVTGNFDYDLDIDSLNTSYQDDSNYFVPDNHWEIDEDMIKYIISGKDIWLNFGIHDTYENIDDDDVMEEIKEYLSELWIPLKSLYEVNKSKLDGEWEIKNVLVPSVFRDDNGDIHETNYPWILRMLEEYGKEDYITRKETLYESSDKKFELVTNGFNKEEMLILIDKMVKPFGFICSESIPTEDGKIMRFVHSEEHEMINTEVN